VSRRVDRIADLLMGAAYADRAPEGGEVDLVRETLAELMSVPALPDWLEWRISDFKPEHHDIQDAVDKLALTTHEEKVHLLELIATVNECDETWDLEEDAYLRKVAAALGLGPEDYADLTVNELSIQRISRVLMPPPLPKS
jgi:hypothetical protein